MQHSSLDDTKEKSKIEDEEQTSGSSTPLSEVATSRPIYLFSLRRPWACLEIRALRAAISLPPVTTTPLSAFATKLYTVSYLIFFSILGSLARIGLQALTYYPGAPVVTGVVWANVGGCFVMGFLIEDKKLFREEWGPSGRNNNGSENVSLSQEVSPAQASTAHKAVKKTIPLYIGLTTGFCGSFTSFSAFITDAFLALTNDLSTPTSPPTTSRSGGYNFMALVAIILYTVSLCLSALICGAHFATALDRLTPTFPFSFLRNVMDRTVVFLAAGCWIGAVVLAIWPPDRLLGEHEHWRGQALFTITLAPLGCLLRYYVSLFLNARIPRFPLGTFMVNIFGTIIEGMCFDLQHAAGLIGVPKSSVNEIATTASRMTSCQVLKGVMDGFCGCTTTVSTWIAEMNSLKRKHAYRYGVASIGLALSFAVTIMGSMRWTIGFGDAVC